MTTGVLLLDGCGSGRGGLDHGCHGGIRARLPDRFGAVAERRVRRALRHPIHKRRAYGQDHCRRLQVAVDLARVSAQLPGKTPLPPEASFEELARLPLEVWLDDEGLVRRIRFKHPLASDGFQTHTLELYDFGTDGAIDWSRLLLLKDPRARAVA